MSKAMYKCVFLATCNAILVLKNVISKECLTCEETFIVKFGKDLCAWLFANFIALKEWNWVKSCKKNCIV